MGETIPPSFAVKHIYMNINICIYIYAYKTIYGWNSFPKFRGETWWKHCHLLVTFQQSTLSKKTMFFGELGPCSFFTWKTWTSVFISHLSYSVLVILVDDSKSHKPHGQSTWQKSPKSRVNTGLRKTNQYMGHCCAIYLYPSASYVDPLIPR